MRITIVRRRFGLLIVPLDRRVHFWLNFYHSIQFSRFKGGGDPRSKSRFFKSFARFGDKRIYYAFLKAASRTFFNFFYFFFPEKKSIKKIMFLKQKDRLCRLFKVLRSFGRGYSNIRIFETFCKSFSEVFLKTFSFSIKPPFLGLFAC